MKITQDKTKNICFLVIAGILALCPVLLNSGVISSSSFVTYIGKCICFCIVAIGLDLIWGYTGILSLGHGLYFALGAYGMGMYLKLQATDGQMTDFMKTGGLKKLPLIWSLFRTLPGTIVLILVIPAGIAGILGALIFRNRIKGVYFSIISQALTWAGYSLFIALSPYTNGNVGITEIQSVFGSIRGKRHFSNMAMLFYVSLAVLIVVYFLSEKIVKSKFGKILIAIRDGENRTYFSGYKVSAYKNTIYVISAMLAAVAGALFINFNGSVTPTQMTITYSITMIIWVAVGGRGTILGPVIGALLINLCEYNLSSGVLVDIWQYIIGGLFVVMILFFKGGLMGILTEQIPAAIRKRKASKPLDKEKQELQAH
ncbi:MAG: urea ABC transporter permease subunit UrtC [Eubacterium sp.]|nr:urea ABC transporter permease subunit UrtC [Eubacterium sp.]